MTRDYQITIGGRYILNGIVIRCPDCSREIGLTFTTPSHAEIVTGSCPGGHIWTEYRVPAVAIREAVLGIEAARRSGSA